MNKVTVKYKNITIEIANEGFFILVPRSTEPSGYLRCSISSQSIEDAQKWIDKLLNQSR